MCECGRVFEKPNSFNGHKSHCEVHLTLTGRLELRQQIDKRVQEELTRRGELQREEARSKKQQQWLDEQHFCKNCGRLMEVKFGSGVFCSYACSNSRGVRTPETRSRISSGVRASTSGKISTVHIQAVTKYNTNPKHCSVCGKTLDYNERHRTRCLECVEQKRFKHSTGIKKEISVEEYNASPNFCFWCNQKIPYSIRTHKYCCDTCFRQSISKQRKDKFAKGEITYSNVRLNYKYGTYQGISCDSSWELAFVLYNIDNGIEFSRNRSDSFTYVYKGKEHRFFPDFLVGNTYIEIKGFKAEDTEAKIQGIPQQVDFKILYYEDIQMYLDYATATYGKDFTRLYDRSHPSWMDKEDMINS